MVAAIGVDGAVGVDAENVVGTVDGTSGEECAAVGNGRHDGVAGDLIAVDGEDLVGVFIGVEVLADQNDVVAASDCGVLLEEAGNAAAGAAGASEDAGAGEVEGINHSVDAVAVVLSVAVDADSLISVIAEAGDAGGSAGGVLGAVGNDFTANADAGGAVGASPDAVGKAAGGGGLAEDGADWTGGVGESLERVAGTVLLNVYNLGGVRSGEVSCALLRHSGSGGEQQAGADHYCEVRLRRHGNATSFQGIACARKRVTGAAFRARRQGGGCIAE